MIYLCPKKVFEDKTLTIDDLRVYMLLDSLIDPKRYVSPHIEWMEKRLKLKKEVIEKCIDRLIERNHFFKKGDKLAVEK